MTRARSPASTAVLLAGGALVVACSGSSSKAGGTGDDGDDCYPDTDGMNDVSPYTIDLTVTDTGFSKAITTQNSSQVTLTLMNAGTTAHGFAVQCTSVTPASPMVPAGCSTTACFPSNAVIAPIAPGASATITFVTPVPDGLLYPFTSNNPADSAVPGLNDGQWNLM